MTFNNNLNNYSDRGQRGGTGSGGGGFGLGGGGGNQGGGGGLFTGLLFGSLARRFGIPGIIVAAILVFLFNGGLGMLGGNNASDQRAGVSNSRQGEGFEHCKTADDANKDDDCRILATATSVDDFWGRALPEEAGIDYTKPGLVIAEGQTSTRCGSANLANTGPFYCPGDDTVYMSTPFFKELKQMGGSDGPFAQMYVTAHEFGHHIQQLEGNLGLSDYDNPGEDSNAVKMEVQADCYAGVWAQNADKGEGALLEPLTQEQVEQAIKTARAIGDDAIQSSAGQEVNPDKWTHGSSKMRMDWFMRGYQGGTMKSCHQDFQR